MITSDKMRRLVIFQPNECDSAADRLRRYALDGWRLVKAGAVCEFERCMPRPLNYRIEYVDKSPEGDEEIKKYILAGWEHIGCIGNMHIFVETISGANPILVDDKRKFECVKREMLRRNIAFWFVLPLICAIHDIIVFLNFDAFVTTNLLITFFIAHIIIYALALSSGLGFVFWLLRSNAALKCGDKPLYEKHIDINKSVLRSLIPLAFISFVTLAAGVLSALADDKTTATVLFLGVFLVSIWLAVNCIIRKESYGSKRNRRFIASVSIWLAALCVLTGAIISLVDVGEAAPDVIAPAEFGVEAPDFQSSERYSRSAFASIRRVTLFDSAETEILTYSIFKSTNGSAKTDYVEFVRGADCEFTDIGAWGAESVFISGGRVFVTYRELVFSYPKEFVPDEKQITEIRRKLGTLYI